MARSKHTRPRQIIAASRVRDPYEPRGANDAAARNRTGAELKQAGVVVAQSKDGPTNGAAPALPRITVQRPRSGHFHPASRADITHALNALGEKYFYGLKSIAMIQARDASADSQLSFGRLVVPGSILLFEQPKPPWLISGALDVQQVARLREAGAIVTPTDGCTPTLVDWPENTLQDFMIFDVLLHELAHHVLQQYTGKRTARIARTKDHEAFAVQMAGRLRGVVSRSK